MAKLKKSKKGKSKPTFKYQARSAEQWKAKAQESSGSFDRYVVDNIERFTPQEGQNKIRILPPTWDSADDWAYKLAVHYGVGPDEQSYLCPKEMGKSPKCPVCEEAARLAKEGDVEDARKLRAKTRKGCWVIDRKDTSSGPQFWAMPFTLARDANVAAEDDDGEILTFDHPQKGYDLMFRREGSRDRTQYIGVKLARKPSPISEDEDEATEWLNYVTEHPVPEVLKVYDYDHIAQVFTGEGPSDDDDEDEDEDEAPTKRGRRVKIEDEDEDEDSDLDDDEDEDEDEEEDADEEVERRGRKAERSVRRRQAKRVVDEDEDDDEDEDEEEDEDSDDEDEDSDDAPRSRRSAATKRLEKAARRAKKKRK